MKDEQASRTAEHNALFRALETRHPTVDRPEGDPFASDLVSDLGAADYRRRYDGDGDGADASRGHEFYRVAHARVRPR